MRLSSRRLLDTLEQLVPGHPRHPVVGDDHDDAGEQAQREQLQRARRRLHGGHPIPGAAQDPSDHSAVHEAVACSPPPARASPAPTRPRAPPPSCCRWPWAQGTAPQTLEWWWPSQRRTGQPPLPPGLGCHRRPFGSSFFTWSYLTS
jgi:hypothetical protein